MDCRIRHLDHMRIQLMNANISEGLITLFVEKHAERLLVFVGLGLIPKGCNSDCF